MKKKKKKSERAEGRGWHSLFTTAPCWHLSCICKRPAAFSLIWDFEMKLFYKITLVVFFRSAITDYILRVKCIFLWFICSLTIKFTLAGKIIISLARCLSAICSKKANLLRSRMSQTRNVWALNTSGWCSFIQQNKLQIVVHISTLKHSNPTNLSERSFKPKWWVGNVGICV